MTILEPHPEHPIAMPVPKAIEQLVDLAECVCALLATEGAGETCWCGLYPGAQVSWEYCTECSADACGMGYVRLASGTPYLIYPQPAIDDRCALPLVWGVEVGAMRCMPVLESGELIPEGLMAEVAIRQMLDARAIRKAIKCCTGDFGLGSWIPQGPQGGCVGGYWQAFMDVD
jgi:hypothetical protein